jgi:hypothetical protein
VGLVVENEGKEDGAGKINCGTGFSAAILIRPQAMMNYDSALAS